MPKTLTEFSGTMIRMAARAEAEARKSIPKELLTVAPAPAPAEGVTAKPDETAAAPAPEAAADSVSDAADQALAQQAEGGSDVSGSGAAEAKPGEAGTADDEMQPGADEEEAREEADAGQDLAGQASDNEKATPSGAKPSEVNADETGKSEPVAETSAVKELLDKAVAEATGTSGDRLLRLREAVRAAGRQAERVRLVRVFGVEEEVAGAKKIGEFQYVVDLMPHSMKQNFERDERDKRRGPRRPSGGGKQKEGSLEGSFSMESVAQDRRNERAGGGGGGRGGRPGGRPGGGGRGRPGGGGGRGGKPGGARKPGP
ncbi:MAG TPA: translation initiation factor 2 [Myxococcales bacterium]|nr:translation initiation factor 2 [Myxococcales bacterium]